MAPFPQADHCISSDPKAEALYIAYGGMFSALRGAKYLLRPHAINMTQPAVANVYELPHAPVRFLSCRRYLLSAACFNASRPVSPVFTLAVSYCDAVSNRRG